MQKSRLQSPLRWLTAVIILLCSLLFIALNPPEKKAEYRPSNPETETINIFAPSKDELTHMQQGLAAAKKILSRPQSTTMQAHLFSHDKVQKKQGMEMQLELIVVGDHHSFAMINNELYERGDTLPEGYKVKEIKPDGVQLQKDSRSQRLDWKDAHPVKLH